MSAKTGIDLLTDLISTLSKAETVVEAMIDAVKGVDPTVTAVSVTAGTLGGYAGASWGSLLAAL